MAANATGLLCCGGILREPPGTLQIERSCDNSERIDLPVPPFKINHRS
jgi:hypothetical protein